MNLSNRNYSAELLDGNHIPFDDIKKNMIELGVINTWLGGHKITIAAAKELIHHNHSKEITICEIGCGGGDNLIAIAKALAKKVSVKFIGIDIKQECINYAKENFESNYNVDWIVSDYRAVNFKHKPDIIFSSLFCHHFKEDQLIPQLKWMKENSSTGFFINDLHRHPLAFYSIKLITSIFSKSYLVKNDAPLSVAKGFTKDEWKNILLAAGINNYTLQWKWAFRHLILYKHERESNNL